MSDDLLEDAILALKAEEADVDDGDATLSRLLAGASADSPHEALLDEALSALRAADAPVSTTLETQTLSRVQASLVGRRGRRWAPLRNAVAVAAVLAIVWVAPSAWAFSRGVVTRWMAEVGLLTVEDVAPSREEPPAPSEPEAQRTPGVPAELLAEPEVPTRSPAPEAAPPVEARPRPAPARREPRAVRTTPERFAPEPESAVPAPEPTANAETLAFTEAHRQHFAGGSPGGSLAAWDAFLRTHPHGRYELEARYNRATSLVRLGRLQAARAALSPFAEGEHDGYRQAEAARLIEALDARLAAETP